MEMETIILKGMPADKLQKESRHLPHRISRPLSPCFRELPKSQIRVEM